MLYISHTYHVQLKELLADFDKQWANFEFRYYTLIDIIIEAIHVILQSADHTLSMCMVGRSASEATCKDSLTFCTKIMA